MPRRTGIGGINDMKLTQMKYKEKGTELAKNKIDTLNRHLRQLRTSLEEFAAKHSKTIKNDPVFRSKFQAMCSTIGVDPIAFSRGCWSEALGLGEFYYHIGIKIIEICMANQRQTGGLMPLDELVKQLNRGRSSFTSEISTDDVRRSVKKLRCLGTGFTIITLPCGRHLVQSVPGEMSGDKTSVLGVAESSAAHVTVTACCNKLSWSEDRARATLTHLVQSGIAWIDDYDPVGERVFWFPSLFDTSSGQ